MDFSINKLFLSTKFENSFARSFGFLRFILLVFALRYYFTLREWKYQKLIFTSWTLIFLLVTFDLLFESYFGFNTLGFKNEYTARLSGFLNQELKIGGYYFWIYINITNIYITKSPKIFLYFFFYIYFNCNVDWGKSQFNKNSSYVITFFNFVEI